MQIQIIAIGKLSKEFTSLASHYIKMVKWPIKNTEITYSKKLPADVILTIYIIICNADVLPEFFITVVKSAFTGHAPIGGFVGSRGSS